ncbi:MAG: hypothetical protein ACI88C_000044 [Acidimicrobiales bacterium]|jgi:hypothetical protein
MTSVNPINFVLNITGASFVTQEFTEMAAAVEGFAVTLSEAQKRTKGAFTVMVRDAAKFSGSISKAFAGYTAGSKNAVTAMEAMAKRISTLEVKITKAEETETAKRQRLRKAALTKRLAEQTAFYGKLNALAATSAQSIVRGIAAVGSIGPAINQSLNAVSGTIKRAGIKSGTSFVGSMVKSISNGLAEIPKLIGGVIGPIVSSVGNLFRAVSSAIVPIAKALGPLIAGGLVSAFAATGPIAVAIAGLVPLFVTVMGGVAAAFAAGLGSLLTIAGGFIQGLGSVLGSITTVVGSVVAKVADALTTLVSSVFSVVKGLVQSTVGTVIDTISGIAGKLGGVAKGIANTILGPVGLIISGLSTKAAADINDKLIDAFALLDDRSAFHLGNTRDRVFELAKAIGVSSNDIASQFFDVVSAGFRVQDEAFEILQRSSELAVAGRASVQEAGEAIVTILKTQKRGYEEAGEVAQALFTIQDRGRLTIGDAARAFSKFGGVITGAKVPIEDLGAALSVLSQQGLGVNEEANQLRRLIEQLAVPTRDTRKAMDAWGVTLHEVSGEERAHLALLDQRLDAEVKYLAELEKGTPAYKEQIGLIADMDNKVQAAIRTRGEWVGYRESIDRLNTAFKRSGKSALTFATEFTSRIRAKQGLSVQLELYDELVEKQEQFADDAGKFGVAVANSQNKVGVQVTKLVESFRQLGVEIYELGQNAIGGDAFGLIADGVEYLRGRVKALKEFLPTLISTFQHVGRSLIAAFAPLTDFSLVDSARNIAEGIGNVFGIGADTASNAFIGMKVKVEQVWDRLGLGGENAFKRVLGTINQLSSVVVGSSSLQGTVVGSVLKVIVAKAKLTIIEMEAEFEKLKNFVVGNFRTAFATVTSFLSDVVGAFKSTVTDIASTVGGGLIELMLTGGGNVAARVASIAQIAQGELAVLTDSLVLSSGGVIEDIASSAVGQQLAVVSAQVAKLKPGFEEALAKLGTGVEIDFLTSTSAVRKGIDLVLGDIANLKHQADFKAVTTEYSVALNEQRKLKLQLEVIEKRSSLNKIKQLVQEGRLTALQAHRKSELEAELVVLGESLETAEAIGAEMEVAATAARDRADNERVSGEAMKLGVESLKAILRVESRRVVLADKLGVKTEVEKGRLDEILAAFDKINRATGEGERSTEKLVNEFQRLVDLSGDAGINVLELVSILNEVQFSAGPASGIGGLKIATGGGRTAPGGDPEGLGLPNAGGPTSKTLSSIDDNLINGFDILGGSIAGATAALTLGTPTSDIGGAAGKHLAELADGTVFEKAIANAFKQVGEARGGVGGFIGAGNKAKGEGFIPFEDFPLELIGEFREQLEAGIPADSLKLSSDTFMQAVNDMLFAQRTGSSPGPGLGRANGFEVSPSGRVGGITPEAIGTELGQAVLTSLAGQQAVDNFLESNGLTHKALGEIKRLMEKRNEQIKAEAAGVTAFGAGASGIANGSKSAVSSKDTRELVQAQQDVIDGEEAVAAAHTAAAAAAVAELEAQEAFQRSKTALTEDIDDFRALEAATEDRQAADLAAARATAQLAEDQGTLNDVTDGGSNSAIGASEAMGGLTAALDILKTAGGDAGELLAEGKLAKSLTKLGIDKDVTDLVKDAERGGDKSAEGQLVDQAINKDKPKTGAKKKIDIEIEGFDEKEQGVAKEVAEVAKKEMEDKAKGFSEVAKTIGETLKGMGDSFKGMLEEIQAFSESIRSAFELMTDEMTGVITEVGEFATDVTTMSDTILEVMTDFRVELTELQGRVQANEQAIAALAKAAGPNG